MEVSLSRIAEIIRATHNIIITAHIHPDGDSLGSMLSLYHYLATEKKNVRLLLDDDVPSLYQFLPGYQDIKKLSPDDKFSVDLLIALDVSDTKRIGKVFSCVDGPVLNIDHHISNNFPADFHYVDTKVSATGEIIMQLLKEMNAVITTDIAVCLYTAIATDCGFFRYANTTADTMRYAADLIDCGVQPSIISEALESKPLSSIHSLTKVLETLELYHNDRIATITILPDTDSSSTENTEGFINYPRNIEGVEVAIMFKVANDDTVKISFRSKKVDVSQLALSFGGGGHVRASGCTINEPVETAKEKVIHAAVKQLQEIGY